MPPRYRLKLNRLDFISAVDQPAQETAKVLLIKRRDVKGFARVAKVDEELGLVFCWAFTSTKADGSDYFDLQGDAIDQDFVKACADFMDGARAVDTMHDGAQSGRVVFAMPMTPEVAKAFGVVTKQIGLMVALRPSAEDLAKFKSGEYTGVSIAGLGTREEVGKRRLRKEAVLTSLVDGHQHTIDLDEPVDGWSDSLQTSYQTAQGATEQHAHAWTFDPKSGAITIGADSGHTHEITTAVKVPDDVLAAAAAEDAADDAENLAAAAMTPTVGAALPAVFSSRAPAAKSTPPIATTTVKPQPEPIAMPTEQEIKIADLTKRNERLERIAKMSGVHKAHFDTLTRDDDAEAFLAKSTSDRDVVVTEIAKRDNEANKVVYVSKSDGAVYRTKDDPRWVDLAKRFDASAESIEKADIRKAAVELLGGMPGEDATHDYIVASIRKGGGDAATIEKATATLKGMKSTSTIGKKAPGAGGDASPEAGTPDEALAALEKGLVGFCKAQKIEKNLWTDGLSAFVQTPEGKALKHAYDEASAS